MCAFLRKGIFGKETTLLIRAITSGFSSRFPTFAHIFSFGVRRGKAPRTTQGLAKGQNLYLERTPVRDSVQVVNRGGAKMPNDSVKRRACEVLCGLTSFTHLIVLPSCCPYLANPALKGKHTFQQTNPRRLTKRCSGEAFLRSPTWEARTKGLSVWRSPSWPLRSSA